VRRRPEQSHRAGGRGSAEEGEEGAAEPGAGLLGAVDDGDAVRLVDDAAPPVGLVGCGGDGGE